MKYEGFSSKLGRISGPTQDGYYAILCPTGEVAHLGWWAIAYARPELPLNLYENNRYYPEAVTGFRIRYLLKGEAEAIAAALASEQQARQAAEDAQRAAHGRRRKQAICKANGLAETDFVGFCKSQRRPGENLHELVERLYQEALQSQ